MCETKFRKGELGKTQQTKVLSHFLLNDRLAKTEWLCLVSLYVEGINIQLLHVAASACLKDGQVRFKKQKKAQKP